jgi:hypothetical protein
MIDVIDVVASLLTIDVGDDVALVRPRSIRRRRGACRYILYFGNSVFLHTSQNRVAEWTVIIRISTSCLTLTQHIYCSTGQSPFNRNSQVVYIYIYLE